MRGRGWALALGPALGLAAGLGSLAGGLPGPAAWTAGITALTATWWVTEPIAIPATSILPFALFPLTGVLTHKDVAEAYGDSLILLLMGGFMLSTAMEKSGAHRRLAVGMVRAVGGSGGRLMVLGFMLATALCSMWISNTATVLMLLPVALAVLEDADEGLAVPLLLGIAYAASIGGLGTPVGTPPNVVFMGIYKQTTGIEIGFVEWMKIGVPSVLALPPLAWLYLTRGLKGGGRVKLPQLPPWSAAEVRVLAVFGLTALAWVTRTAPFGGWAGFFGVEGAGDATVALAAVSLMFVLPDGQGSRLLDWPTAAKIPWGLLMLFGGGIAIAKAFQSSGLSAAMGTFMAEDLGIAAWPAVAMTLAVCLAVTFLTEITSNTATTTLLMPVLAAAALAAQLDPKVLMVPAALSASCAFMLPVATAPNAIVFGTDKVTIQQMARAGLALNLAGAVALTVVCLLVL